MREKDRTIILDNAIALSNVISEQCDALVEMCDYLDERIHIARRISSFESNADDAYHEVGLYFLENKLMTDPDAVSMFNIVRALEEITDAYEELSNSFVRYNISELGASIAECSTALYGASQLTHDIVIYFKDNSPMSLLLRDIAKLDKYKTKYCKFYDEAILELFTQQFETIDVIRYKAIYDAFKDIFEAYESFAENCYQFVLSYY